ncbi:hypothetical protein CMUS01_03845 [Colletotrichum musicola]|uniref:Uncharacterized protein n=1 Tax=Colletotrichum musicola TaxID=2175873 RepID=A0A8H6U4P5_9PEZI|nr:hypothetical protein CMUS01_03845 [Colletotrichum musicola]
MLATQKRRQEEEKPSRPPYRRSRLTFLRSLLSRGADSLAPALRQLLLYLGTLDPFVLILSLLESLSLPSSPSKKKLGAEWARAKIAAEYDARKTHPGHPFIIRNKFASEPNPLAGSKPVIFCRQYSGVSQLGLQVSRSPSTGPGSNESRLNSTSPSPLPCPKATKKSKLTVLSWERIRDIPVACLIETPAQRYLSTLPDRVVNQNFPHRQHNAPSSFSQSTYLLSSWESWKKKHPSWRPSRRPEIAVARNQSHCLFQGLHFKSLELLGYPRRLVSLAVRAKLRSGLFRAPSIALPSIRRRPTSESSEGGSRPRTSAAYAYQADSPDIPSRLSLRVSTSSIIPQPSSAFPSHRINNAEKISPSLPSLPTARRTPEQPDSSLLLHGSRPKNSTKHRLFPIFHVASSSDDLPRPFLHEPQPRRQRMSNVSPGFRPGLAFI